MAAAAATATAAAVAAVTASTLATDVELEDDVLANADHESIAAISPAAPSPSSPMIALSHHHQTKRAVRKPSSRPSTASAVEDKPFLLPSASSSSSRPTTPRVADHLAPHPDVDPFRRSVSGESPRPVQMSHRHPR
jgi:hypothetical protein